MPNTPQRFFYSALATACVFIPIAIHAQTGSADSVDAAYVVDDETLNPVSDLLFGQFLEIASWGELGPEALVDPDTGELPDDIIELLQQLHSTVTRYPGGVDIDYIDWTDRIDDAPGRAEAERPVTETRGNTMTNRFGYDEFLKLAERLDTEPLLVVNLKAGLNPGSDLDAAAQHAAALVAYCNADPDDESLPAWARPWAQLRQTNGRAEPWGVTYWQVGNETWAFVDELAVELKLEDEAAKVRWYVDAMVVFAEAMRAVDPSIKLISDGKFKSEAFEKQFFADPRVREHYEMITLHTYAPGGPVEMTRDEQPISPEAVGPEGLWYAWVSMPSVVIGDQWLAKWPDYQALRAGGDLAMTEWNWNGWGGGIGEHAALSSHAAGLGAAAYLHGLMRQGDRFKLATQSMMLGVSWGLASIHADPDGKHPPFISATGAATALYSQHHGDRRLALATPKAPPAIEQNLTLTGWGTFPARSPLPLVDVLATRSDDALYLHAVQRSMDQPLRVEFDVSSLIAGDAQATAHALVPRDADHPGVAKRDVVRRVESSVAVRGGVVNAELPAGSVTVIVVPLD